MLILIPFCSIVLSSLFCETRSLNEAAVWLDRLVRKHRDLPYLSVSTPSAPLPPVHNTMPSFLRGFCAPDSGPNALSPCCLPCPGLCF